MSFEALIFDLDDTLYPSTSGVWDAIGHRIDRFMIDVVHLPVDEVPGLRRQLFKEYGTTLRGLSAVYHINEQDYLDFVHDIPLENYLRPDPSLRGTLQMYPQRKIIFTNADTRHAMRVIQTLGLNEIFDQIVDIQAIKPYCKPQREAYELALKLAGIQHPEMCIVLDDNMQNLQTASGLGMFSIKVGVNDCPAGCDAAILSLLDLPSVIPTSLSIGAINER